jgi:hypothetical protein
MYLVLLHGRLPRISFGSIILFMSFYGDYGLEPLRELGAVSSYGDWKDVWRLGKVSFFQGIHCCLFPGPR